MAVTICHASIDEHGSAINGAAGDQTKKEVCSRSWYRKPWGIMLRYKDENIAKQAAIIAKKLADSNLVGYDQNQRNTLYQALKKNDFNVDKYIKSGVKTETDCSAFLYAVYCCVIPSMRADENAPTTSTMKTKYLHNGFTVYTESKYTSSDAKLKIGDVLDKPGSHAVMVISIGAAPEVEETPVKPAPNNSKYYPKYTGTSVSIVEALKAIGVKDVSLAYRKKIASANGIANYTGTAAQNSKMVKLAKQGLLIKA